MSNQKSRVERARFLHDCAAGGSLQLRGLMSRAMSVMDLSRGTVCMTGACYVQVFDVKRRSYVVGPKRLPSDNRHKPPKNERFRVHTCRLQHPPARCCCSVGDRDHRPKVEIAKCASVPFKLPENGLQGFLQINCCPMPLPVRLCTFA